MTIIWHFSIFFNTPNILNSLKYLEISVAPRIHCISIRRLGPCFPLLNPVHIKIPTEDNTSTDDSKIKNTKNTKNAKKREKDFCKSPWDPRPLNPDSALTPLTPDRNMDNILIKKWVVDRFTAALHGDSLAAEYVTLSILSRLYNRQESESLLLGSLPLNLCLAKKEDGLLNKLKAALEEFVPLCVQVDCQYVHLNSVLCIVCKSIILVILLTFEFFSLLIWCLHADPYHSF